MHSQSVTATKLNTAIQQYSSLIRSAQTTNKQTNKQTNKHYEKIENMTVEN